MIAVQKQTGAMSPEADHLYRSLLESIGDPVMIYSQSRGFLDCNRAVLEKLGYSRAEFLALEVDQVVHPDFQTEIPEHQQRVLAGESLITEARHCRKDGTTLPVELHASLIEYEGEPAILAVVRDITARKKAEARLCRLLAMEELATAISTTFINAPIAEFDGLITEALESVGHFAGADRCYINLVSTDGSYIVQSYEWHAVYAPSLAEKVIGLRREKFSWMSDILQRSQSLYIPAVDEMPPEAGPFKEFLQKAGVQSLLALPLLSRQRCIGFFGLSVVHSSRVRAWTDEDTRLLQLVGEVFVNALERKQGQTRQKRLLQAEQNQRQLAETVIEATRILNSSLERAQVLEAILEQLSRVVAYDSALVMLIHEETHEVVAHRGFRLEEGYLDILPLEQLPHVQEVLEERQPVIITDTAVDARWFDRPASRYIRCWLGAPLIVKNRVIGLLNLNKRQPDVYTPQDAELAMTFADQAAIAIENARLYQQVRQDAITKADLLKEINHRVKNNLLAISGLLVTEKRHLPPSEKATVAPILDRLNRRVDGLQAVHKILSQSEWSPISLSELVEQVILATLKPSSGDIQPVVEVSPTAITVSPRQASNLGLIFNELATNTIKHTDEPIHIRVDFALEEETIIIEYRDNGPGYPDSILGDDRISQERLNGTSSSMGLYLVYRIVTGTLGGIFHRVNRDGAVARLMLPIEKGDLT